MDIIVISFADSRYTDSLNRLRTQCSNHPDITTFYGYTERNLPKIILEKIGDRLSYNRGYGYWIWKPFIIQYHLEMLTDEECLIYIDAGCNIRYVRRSDMPVKALCSMSKQEEYKGLLVFQKPRDKEDGLYPDYYREEHWTKEDIFSQMGIDLNSVHRDSPQIVSGVIILNKTKDVSNLIDRWRDFMYLFPNLSDDSPSKAPNTVRFIENRHDQSLFSLLAKKSGFVAVSTELIEGHPALFGGAEILAVRDINNRMNYRKLIFFLIMVFIRSPRLAVQGYFRFKAYANEISNYTVWSKYRR